MIVCLHDIDIVRLVNKQVIDHEPLSLRLRQGGDCS